MHLKEIMVTNKKETDKQENLIIRFRESEN